MSERAPLIGAIVHIELDPLLLSDPRSAEHVHALLKIRAEQDAELAAQDAATSTDQQAARILRRVREEIEHDSEQGAPQTSERHEDERPKMTTQPLVQQVTTKPEPLQGVKPQLNRDDWLIQYQSSPTATEMCFVITTLNVEEDQIDRTAGFILRGQQWIKVPVGDNTKIWIWSESGAYEDRGKVVYSRSAGFYPLP